MEGVELDCSNSLNSELVELRKKSEMYDIGMVVVNSLSAVTSATPFVVLVFDSLDGLGSLDGFDPFV